VLIGTLPAPITAAPLVILIYLVLLLMVAAAVASVLLRNSLYALGAFCATMLLVAILYLTIAPALLFAFQLLVFTTISAAVLVALLRQTTGLEGATVGPFSREWIAGAAVSAALLALVGVVMAATNWPVQFCCSIIVGFTETLSNTYVVGIWTLAVLLGSAALGCGLMLAAPVRPVPTGGRISRGRGRSNPRGVDRPRSARAPGSTE
jgi:NADH:ubiquinone oxidoreductase subunit 6 (subunit J)